ncbi:hypothetical protein Tco_0785257 [Tanacetum coccineum]
MLVQNQIGKGSAMPTDPHHTPTITQPSTSQPQKSKKPKKPKRKNTQVPQPSGSSEHVADEAVHKEWVTDCSLGTTSGGGPRCQEIMGDTIVQTRLENVSKHSNDLLLARGNTLRSDEDSIKLKELMELCTNLQQRVLDLEKTKTTWVRKICEELGRGVNWTIGLHAKSRIYLFLYFDVLYCDDAYCSCLAISPWQGVPDWYLEPRVMSPSKCKFCWGIMRSTGIKRYMDLISSCKIWRTNRKCHIPIDLYPCKVEESITMKKLGDQTIGVIRRRMIDKERNVSRFQEYHTSDEEEEELSEHPPYNKY